MKHCIEGMLLHTLFKSISQLNNLTYVLVFDSFAGSMYRQSINTVTGLNELFVQN